MLIIKGKRVTLGGLPSYLVEYQNVSLIEFDPYNLNELRAKLATVISSFREWIETKRRNVRQEFYAGALLGSSKMMRFAFFK